MYKVGRITLMDFRKVKVEHLTGSRISAGLVPFMLLICAVG